MRTVLLNAPRLPRLGVGAKVTAAVGVLLAAALAVAAVAVLGLQRTDARFDRVYASGLQTTQATADLGSALEDVQRTTLRQILSIDAAETAALDVEFDQVHLPAVQRSLERVRALSNGDPTVLARLDAVRDGLDDLLDLRATGALGTVGTAANDPAVNADLARRTSTLLAAMTSPADELRDEAVAYAAEVRQEAEREHAAMRLALALIVGVAILAGVAVAVALVRDLVPRIRDYSRFAGEVAAGGEVVALDPRGRDELAELGRALDHMLGQRQRVTARGDATAEYVDTLQVMSSEEEAHELVQRHVERSLPGRDVVVLQRNNSANRLEAVTALAEGTDLRARLVGAEPRACIALRFGRPHREGEGERPLLGCTLCSREQGSASCEPLLVGGEVIGSVLVTGHAALDHEQDAQVKEAVAQAAPVLANLRNLALAEFRANNDSLTGLPNKRATDDTVKRLVAQAERSLTPLAALMLDLDHFKQINDRFGHGKGDEVLAAVGAAVQECLREGDFAGRFGGEEILVLLPDTDLGSARVVAERIRASIEGVAVVGVERAITVSIGCADLLTHGGSVSGLLREADRALYAAKGTGRNRVVVASVEHPEGDRPEGEPLVAAVA